MPDGSSIGARDALRDRRIGMAFVLIPSSIIHPPRITASVAVLHAGWIARGDPSGRTVQDRVRQAA
jgi:hypothetical protein